MSRIIATTLAGFLLFAAPAVGHHGHGCKTKKCHERVADKQRHERLRVLSRRCTQRNPRGCVEYVIARKRIRGWQAAWMRRVPGCESSWNPYATNGPHVGLFQFRVAPPSTWATTPYAVRSPWSARWQAFAAAWMLKVGRAPGEWACK